MKLSLLILLLFSISIDVSAQTQDTPASFKGDLKEYLKKNVRFPKKAVEQGIKSGSVDVTFRVDEEGAIYHPYVSKSSNSLFDKEALRVIYKMPDWNPATKKGEPVRSGITITVEFVLE